MSRHVRVIWPLAKACISPTFYRLYNLFIIKLRMSADSKTATFFIILFYVWLSFLLWKKSLKYSVSVRINAPNLKFVWWHAYVNETNCGQTDKHAKRVSVLFLIKQCSRHLNFTRLHQSIPILLQSLKNGDIMRLSKSHVWRETEREFSELCNWSNSRFYSF